MFAKALTLLAGTPESVSLPQATCIKARTDWSSVATKPLDYLVGNIYGLATPIAVLIFVCCFVAGMALVRSQKASGLFKAGGMVILIIVAIPVGAALLYKISSTAPALC